MTRELIEHLAQFVTARRLNLFDKVLDFRTRYLTVVLEDIFQPHNASAVLRSCECFGIQDVHIIENQNEYQINPDVTLGSNKWLNLIRYNTGTNNTQIALHALKTAGYRIVATSPHKKSNNLHNFDITKGPFALLFGTELNGLSSMALESADDFIHVPMVGFTESLNISVTAAICIYHLSDRIRNDQSLAWHLDEHERDLLKLNWLRQSVKNSSLIEKAFLERQRDGK